MPQGPYKLVTVNNAPERAYRLVGRIVEDVKDKYTIIHAGNAESPEAAKSVFEQIKPDIVFTASMWSPEQSSKVLAEAKAVNPNCKTLALPQGLQVQQGPDAVVEFIKEQIPGLIGS
ncbi:hypothetical protein BAUCODRAFT_467052 [Baudoinia panamericana UAMH 10762]|uniref:Uncharacterized protein n=1 Tax=Baudoinia panamericana (strain UAMH 10762) TaxID=717646 RepID=M2NAP6_BAUPA|nr:uncharacterized protein BAUCODRAFT_467052 [Baudoinia panamericana UAMH 10762]EMC96214.1 hypothetical protein BAUCODRAFT_467052 [Baudoinia panamericana UAMH 10762]